MRRELIEQQGFVTSATGFCRQNDVPSPTSPQDIITPNGVLGYSGGTYSGDGDYYFIDGAGKEYHMPLMLEGDTIEINWRTMNAKLTHRFKATRLLGTYAFVASSSYDGSVYIGAANVRSYFPDAKYRTGKIFCNYFRNQSYVSGETSATGKGKIMWGGSNDSLNIWAYDSETEASSNPKAFFQNNTVYFVYELATPRVEYIDLSTKLRNHPLMEVGTGVELRTLTFEQGYINNLGNLVEDANYITSDYIEGGNPFRIRCNTGYKVNQVHLFDENNNLVSFKFYDNSLYYRNYYADGQHFEFELPKDYKMRITIIANSSSGTSASTPEAAITPTDDAIESYRVINTRYYRREYLTNINYIYGYTRAKQLLNCTYTPLITKNYKRTSFPDSFIKGNVKMGIPYSECGDKNKFIGKDVSFKSFVTAVNNPLSLFYTETPYSSSDFNPQRVSAYGYTTAPNEYVVTETDGTLYFGTVCACLIDYVFGYDENYTARQYKYYNFKNGTRVTLNSDCTNIHPMDICCANSHVALVADVLKDIDGNVKFIQVIESVSPYVRSEYYSPEEFYTRFGTSVWYIYHYNNLSIPKPEETPFIPVNPDDIVIPLEINNDICTIGGDYATFLSTDAIHLSINNTSGNWQGVKIYDSNNQLVDTIYFTDTAYCTSHTISTLNQTWIDVDISHLFSNNTGLFTAVAYNSNSQSNPTHFEVIDAQVNIYRCESVNNVVFKATGEPYCIINGTANGYTYTDTSWTESSTGWYQPHFITGAEMAIQNKGNENIMTRWDGAGNSVLQTNRNYFRTMVKGAYGYATHITATVVSKTNKATFTLGSYLDANGNIVTGSSYGAITDYMTVGFDYTYQFVFKDASSYNLPSRLQEYSYDEATGIYTPVGGVITLAGQQSNSGLFVTVRYRPTSSNVNRVRISTVNGHRYKQFFVLT